MSGVRAVWMIGDIVLPGASSCRTGTASSPYTRYAEEKERRCFWRQGEGGDWASVDEQDEADLMCGHVWMDSRRCVTPEPARISKPGLTLSTSTTPQQREQWQNSVAEAEPGKSGKRIRIYQCQSKGSVRTIPCPMKNRSGCQL